MQTDSDRLISETRAERERLAALLGGLSPEQWAAPSLCAGWRVREVAAHITMPFRTRPLGFVAGVAGAGFSFNRYADRDARSTARKKSQAELIDLLRRNIDNPWQPPAAAPRARSATTLSTASTSPRRLTSPRRRLTGSS